MTSDDSTSLSKMKTLQFNDKMATLNRDFLKSLRVWYEQCPHYDFSDTVKSYVKHVKNLEEIYGLPVANDLPVTDENQPIEPGQNKDTSPNENHPERKIAKARRRLNADPSKLNDSVAVSTPAGAPPRFSLGNISAIGTVDATPKVSLPEPPSAQGGRKRIIRGGGPTGGAESVHFRGTGASSNSLTIPAVTIQLPQPNAGFWDKHKDSSHKGTMPIFDLVKPTKEVLPPIVENKYDEDQIETDKESGEISDVSDPELPKPTNIFDKPATSEVKEKAGGNKFGFAGSFPVFGKKDDGSGDARLPFSFASKGNSDRTAGDNKESEKEKQTFPFGGFKKTESDKPASSIFGKKEEDGDAAKQTLSFPVFGKKEDSNSDAKPAISFPSFGKKEDDGPKAALSFPSFSSASSKSIFGNPATSGTLAFNPPPASNATNKDDEDGEYVPPKAEVVENNEPGATYSTKCSVFKMVDKKFEKLGVGMLHLKETDGKKSVLIRAATAIGTVWLNALISSAMKVVKADDKGDKLRMTAPLSTVEMGIFLIRFANVASADVVQKHIEENNK